MLRGEGGREWERGRLRKGWRNPFPLFSSSLFLLFHPPPNIHINPHPPPLPLHPGYQANTFKFYTISLLSLLHTVDLDFIRSAIFLFIVLGKGKGGGGARSPLPSPPSFPVLPSHPSLFCPLKINKNLLHFALSPSAKVACPLL